MKGIPSYGYSERVLDQALNHAAATTAAEYPTLNRHYLFSKDWAGIVDAFEAWSGLLLAAIEPPAAAPAAAAPAEPAKVIPISAWRL